MILIDRMDPGFISRIYKNKKISITRERKEKKQGMRGGSMVRLRLSLKHEIFSLFFLQLFFI